MKFTEFVEEVRDLHNQLQKDSKNKYEVSIIKLSNREKPVIIGNFDELERNKKLKITIYGITEPKYKSLEGIYNSKEEFELKATKLTKIIKPKHSQSSRFSRLIRPSNLFHIHGNKLVYGFGRLIEIGKVRMK